MGKMGHQWLDSHCPRISPLQEKYRLTWPILAESNYLFSNLSRRVLLLEILTDKKYRNIIKWAGTNGELELIVSVAVAASWGLTKNNEKMCYYSLARALRYYYDGDMINKVKSVKFSYKFVCDLKDLIGKNVQELCDMMDGTPRKPHERRKIAIKEVEQSQNPIIVLDQPEAPAGTTIELSNQHLKYAKDGQTSRVRDLLNQGTPFSTNWVRIV